MRTHVRCYCQPLQTIANNCKLALRALPMFDPNIPATNAEATSAMFRGQFNGLKDLIDAIQSIGSATVDGVNTLPPGEPATVTLDVANQTLKFTFSIPQGEAGSSGDPGPPFADAVLEAVNTLPPGDPATVESSFDGATVFLTFGIPAGEPGPEGPMGEVSQQQLDDAIATTSANSNAVDTLGMAVSDPPTQAEVQQIADKLDELILALRR